MTDSPIPKLRQLLKSFRTRARALKHVGMGRWCPICGWRFRSFLPAGLERRPNARCPRCSSVERHRLVWLYFARRTNLFDSREKRVLHVAPEACLEERLKNSLGASYLTADIARPSAMLRMDIRNIQFPDQSFDVIYCSHVLEHVREDRLAMTEFARVLRPDGWALILVPIRSKITEEDDSVVDPEERLARYGHPDHVRNYGADFSDRLRQAGLTVEEVRPQDYLTDRELILLGVAEANETLFVCKRARS